MHTHSDQVAREAGTEDYVLTGKDEHRSVGILLPSYALLQIHSSPYCESGDPAELDCLHRDLGEFDHRSHETKQLQTLASTGQDDSGFMAPEHDLVHSYHKTVDGHLVGNQDARHPLQQARSAQKLVAQLQLTDRPDLYINQAAEHGNLKLRGVPDRLSNRFDEQVLPLDHKCVQDHTIPTHLRAQVHHPVMLGFQVLVAVAPLVQDHEVLCGRLQLCGPVVDRDQALLDRQQHILMVDNQRKLKLASHVP
jgi:hypothetical protein